MDPIVKPAPKKGGRWRRFVALIAGMLALGLVPLAGQAVAPQSSPVLAPTSAYAGAGCDASKGFICGRVLNSVGSNSNVNVHDGWGSNDGIPGGEVRQLAPGNWSKFRDTDGYCIPPNVQAYAFIYSAFSIGLQYTYSYPPDSGWRCQKIGDDKVAVIFLTKVSSKSKAAQPMSSSPNWDGMKKTAKAKVKSKAISVCKVAKKTAKNQKSKYYKKYKKYFTQCAKLGVKVPKK